MALRFLKFTSAEETVLVERSLVIILRPSGGPPRIYSFAGGLPELRPKKAKRVLPREKEIRFIVGRGRLIDTEEESVRSLPPFPLICCEQTGIGNTKHRLGFMGKRCGVGNRRKAYMA